MIKHSAMLLPALLILVSCTLTTVSQPVSLEPGATLHLYLQPLPQEAQNLTLTISALNACNSDGREIPLLKQPLQLIPKQRLGRQTRLLIAPLPPGEYSGLSLEISSASIATDDGPADLLIKPTQKLIPATFMIRPDRNETLFLALQPERLITAGYQLTARFSLWKPQSPLSKMKGLISHPATGTVTLFEKVTPRVVSVLAVARNPAGLVADRILRRAYLALPDEDSIAVLDMVQDTILQQIRLHSADRPVHLALSADRRRLGVANPGSNSISIFDTDSFTERERLIFSSKPGFVFSGVKNNLLYVSLPDANALALVDMDRATIVSTTHLAETPLRGATGRDGKQIFLLTEDSPYLLVVDAQTLTIDGQIDIGFNAQALAINKNNGLIYIGLKNGEISVVDPRVALPIDGFRIEGEVTQIVPDLDENSLFILTGGASNRLSKFDLTSHKRLGILELNAAGFDLVIMAER